MSTTLMTEPAAGWYHDPADADAWRWWDGAIWTDHIRQKDVPAPVAPVPIALAEGQATPAVVIEPVPTHAPVFTIVESGPSIPQPGQIAATPSMTVTGSVPMTPATPVGDQMYWHSSAAELIEVPRLTHPITGSVPIQGGTLPSYVRDWQDLGSPNTAGVWLLAFSPLLSVVISFVITLVNAMSGGAFGSFASYVSAGVFVGVCWVFAYADQRALGQRGYHAPAIWWMLLLPPLVYLIARGKAVRRESMRAWPPELVFFLLLVGMTAAAVAASVVIAAAFNGSLTAVG